MNKSLQYIVVASTWNEFYGPYSDIKYARDVRDQLAKSYSPEYYVKTLVYEELEEASTIDPKKK